MKTLSLAVLRLFGWRFDGAVPVEPKYVLIGAPHTTNWDFFVFLAVLRSYRLSVRFLGKDSLFRGPLGWFLYRLGGVPVDRSRSAGLVAEVAVAMDEADRFALVITPEGTRSGGGIWKSGFYRIATEAAVPVVPGRIDYSARTVTIGEPIYLTGDVGADMDRIRSFYGDLHGHHRGNEAEIRLSDEN